MLEGSRDGGAGGGGDWGGSGEVCLGEGDGGGGAEASGYGWVLETHVGRGEGELQDDHRGREAVLSSVTGMWFGLFRPLLRSPRRDEGVVR